MPSQYVTLRFASALALVALLHGTAQSAGRFRILFHGYVDRAGRSATAMVSADGLSDVTEVPFPKGGELSPTGAQIAFDTCSRDNRAVAIAAPDRSEMRTVAPVSGESCVTVRWAHDGTRLSYAGADDFVVHVVDLVTGVDTALPTTFFATGWHTWSSKGDAIAYESGRGGARRIDVVDLATWRTRHLVGPDQFGTCEVWAPDWSPTDDRVVFTTCDQKLFVVSAAGDHLKQLAADAYAPRWTPDGAAVLFLTARTLRRIPADGGRATMVGQLPFHGGPFSLAAR